MIGCLRTRVRKQPIIALYFDFETALKLYNLESKLIGVMFILLILSCNASIFMRTRTLKLLYLPNFVYSRYTLHCSYRDYMYLKTRNFGFILYNTFSIYNDTNQIVRICRLTDQSAQM